MDEVGRVTLCLPILSVARVLLQHQGQCHTVLARLVRQPGQRVLFLGRERRSTNELVCPPERDLLQGEEPFRCAFHMWFGHAPMVAQHCSDSVVDATLKR